MPNPATRMRMQSISPDTTDARHALGGAGTDCQQTPGRCHAHVRVHVCALRRRGTCPAWRGTAHYKDAMAFSSTGYGSSIDCTSRPAFVAYTSRGGTKHLLCKSYGRVGVRCTVQHSSAHQELLTPVGHGVGRYGRHAQQCRFGRHGTTRAHEQISILQQGASVVRLGQDCHPVPKLLL